MALGDQAGKAAVDELVGQLPELKQFIADQLAELQNTVKQCVADARAEIETVVGGSLAAVTAERTEAINQFADVTHSIIDRLSGLSIQIPARK